MHEFSLGLEVIELVQREVINNRVTSIQEIIIEVGDLSGVDADAFETALGLLAKDTLLDKSVITLIRTPGKGKCVGCKLEFVMTNRIDTCPTCRCFPSEISGGEEFKVLSILAEQD